MSSCAWGKVKEGGEIIKERKGKGFELVVLCLRHVGTCDFVFWGFLEVGPKSGVGVVSNEPC